MNKGLARGVPFFLVVVMVVSGGEAVALSGRLLGAEKAYLSGDYARAAKEAERVFDRYSKGATKNEAAYLAGLSHLKSKNTSEAKRYLEYLFYNSDDSMMVKEAQIGLDNLSESTRRAEEPELFSVQLGSFSSKKNADRMYRKLKRKKYTVRVVEEAGGGKTAYKVKIGRFKSRADARQFAKKMKRRGCQTAVVAY